MSRGQKKGRPKAAKLMWRELEFRGVRDAKNEADAAREPYEEVSGTYGGEVGLKGRPEEQ